MRLRHLPGAARLAVAAFVLLLFGFHVAAQATLWVRDGGGAMPSAQDVLEKYHGRPDSTALHDVLDLDRPMQDPRAMWPFLHPDGPAQMLTIRARREAILAWVERGAPREGWEDLAPVFTDVLTCGACHAPGRSRQDLPFTTYEEVLEVTRPDRGMRPADLLVSAHNHVFAFAVMALLLALGVAFTATPRSLQVLLVLAAFGGAALDVGSWFLTRSFGAPWHLAVMVGGGLFGLATAAMALAILVEVVRGSAGPSGRIAARDEAATGPVDGSRR